MEFGDGFLGQELMRTEIFSLGLIGGAWDRISISLNAFTETRGNEMSGTFLRAKGRIGPVLGRRSSAGVAFAISTSARESGDVQDEQVNSFDFAIPAEFLLETSQNRKRDLSGYLAPRVVFENYVDQLDRTQSLTATYWGALAGVHARVSNGHFFGELNLLHLPRRTARGTELAGGFIVVPALGFAFHFGQAHRWED